MNERKDTRYLLKADMGYEEPMKGVWLRVEDRAGVIDRAALTATCRGVDCDAGNVGLVGRLD